VLPKGQIEPGETAQDAALREVAEETGANAAPVAALGRIEYWFRDKGERVLKTVSFFLVSYRSGVLGRLPPGSEREVAEVSWLPLEQAPALLAYSGEQEIAGRALELLRAGQDV
jgi:8-oxo-dGTP pyrophosphatase MutT (NUDIX family)